ncbi:MAG: GAF domain-containing protein, partial [Gemmatimonadota bacterium]
EVQTEAIFQMPAEELGRRVPAGRGLAGRVLEERGPVIMDRSGDLPRPIPDDAMLDDAVVGVPIERGGELIGFFGIGLAADPETGRPPRRFTQADVATLTVFARHAAIAIDNARRYEREQRRTERLELIARVGRILTGHLALDDLLQSAARAIHERLGYPNVAIGIVEAEDPEALQLTFVGRQYGHLGTGRRLPLDRGVMGAAAREPGPSWCRMCSTIRDRSRCRASRIRTSSPSWRSR